MTEKRWAVAAIMIDLDGTLLDSLPDMAAAANGALVEAGFAPMTESDLKVFLGKGVPYLAVKTMERAVGRPLTDDEIEPTVARFKRHYHRTNGEHTKVFPGVLAGLEAFKAAGFKLACVTNKAAEFTEPLLAKTGILPFLDVVVSGDTTAKRKPDPEPVWHGMEKMGVETAVMIGDSINDIAAAKNAKIPAICVTYGYGDASSVEADAFVDSFLSVLPMISRTER